MKTSRIRSILSLFFLIAGIATIAFAASARKGGNVIRRIDPITSAAGPQCTAPGVEVQSDPANDQLANQGNANQQLDLRTVHIAEPFVSAADHSIVFTLKVANLTGGPQASSNWAVYMQVKASNGTTQTIFFDMNTIDTPGVVGYNYGYTDENGTDVSQGAGTVITGTQTADGTITLKVNTATPLSFNNIAMQHQFDVNLLPANTSLTGIYGQTAIFLGALGNGGSLFIDTTTLGTGTYLTVGNAACQGAATPTPTPTPTPGPTTTNPPRFFNYYPPTGIGENAGEPSIGINWKTEKSFFNRDIVTGNANTAIPNGGTSNYFGGFMTAMVRATFSDCSSPAGVVWEQKALTSPNAPRVFGDPILFTDSTLGRTFVSQLIGLTPAGSTTDFTDNDGDTFTPTTGAPLPSDVDHQTIGGGPYAFPLNLNPPNPTYPHAVYYASQSVADARAAISVDGGITYGPGVPMYTVAQCAGLHGHIKVAPDGTAYVPNKACGGALPFHDTGANAAVIVSENNGASWTIRPVPTSTATAEWDSSLGIATDGTIYLGYQGGNNHAYAAVSHDRGLTWSTPIDVGAAVGVESMVFAEVVAGDGDEHGANTGRAAFSFIGSETSDAESGPNHDEAAFTGVWYLYVASTFDSGQTWTTQKVTPDDPIQRGGICKGGTCRNLLDFYDAQVDKEGRVMLAGEDGCIGSCVFGGANSYTAKAFITRQTGGKRLFAQYDPVEPAVPGAPKVTAFLNPATTAHLSWPVPDGGGETITSYKIYRSVAGAAFSLLATQSGTSFIDSDSGADRSYRVTAVNAQGESPYCGDVVPVAGPPPSACTSPGIRVIYDFLTPSNQPNDFGVNIPPDPRVDIQQVHISEPFSGPGVNKLVFRIQVGASTAGAAPASSQWFIIWTKKAPNANFDRNWVGMRTDAMGVPRFEYGDFGVNLNPTDPNLNGNDAIKKGDADPGSSYDPATGVITIVMSNSKIENPQAGETMPAMICRTFLAKPESETKQSQSAADTTDPSNYTLTGNAACQVGVPLVSVSSRKVHTAQGPFDVDLPLTGPIGIECRDGGDNGDYQMVFTFANPLMNVGGATVTGGTGSVVGGQGNVANTFEYVVDLTGVLDKQKLTVTITGVTDTVGNTTPSLAATVGVLEGDSNADTRVNIADTNQTKANAGPTTNSKNFRTDFNFDGRTDIADTNYVKNHAGGSLPP